MFAKTIIKFLRNTFSEKFGENMLKIFKPKTHANFLKPSELENVCRICLHTAENLSQFNKEITILLSEFLPLKINLKPVHAHQICVKCFEEAKVAYIFKKQCEYSNKLIKVLLNEPDIQKTVEKETQTDFSKSIYPCEKCDKKCESLAILREHRLKEHYDTPNTCRICTKSFTKIGTLRDHLGSAHPELGFSCSNRCFLCNKSFTRKYHLKKHLIGIHKAHKNLKIDDKIMIEENLLTGDNCQLCPEFFDTKDDLRKHVLKAHKTNEKFLPQNFKTSDMLAIKKYEFNCEFCFGNFDILDNLKNHICPINFPSENLDVNVNLSEKLELTETFDNKLDIDSSNDGALINEVECASIFEDNSKTEDEDAKDRKEENNKISSKIIPKTDEQQEDVKTMPFETKTIKNEKGAPNEVLKRTKEIVKSMISESKRNNAKINVKPNEEGKYECDICKETFVKAADLVRHNISHSGVTKPYTCTICSKSFVRADNLKNHVNCVHADIRPFKCTICEKSFTRNEHLQRHTNRQTCLIEKKSRPLQRLFPCKLCKSKFTTEKRLEDHIGIRHDESREFSCKTCSKKIIGTTAYKKHCRVHYTAPEREYLCSHCGKSFTKYHCFTIHTRIHTGEKPYKCRYCGKAFPRSTDQYAHERLHRGEKNYVCTECSKAFATNYKLRIHMRIHTGERPYKCTYCPRGFAEKSDLTKHLRQHTGERFYCNLCDMSSAQRYLLRRHKREVHGVIEPGGRVFLLDKIETQETEKNLESKT